MSMPKKTIYLLLYWNVLLFKQAALNILKLLSELDQQLSDRTANGQISGSVSGFCWYIMTFHAGFTYSNFS